MVLRGSLSSGAAVSLTGIAQALQLAARHRTQIRMLFIPAM